MLCGVAVAGLLYLAGFIAVVAVAGALLGGAAFVRPHLAIYVFLPATLLSAGVERGVLVPVLRPNEALLLLLGGAIVARGVVLAMSGYHPTFRITSLDLAVFGLCLAGSFLPPLSMWARSRAMTQDDFLYALTLLKYFGLYVLARTTIKTQRHVATVLWLTMATAATVALIGIVQSLSLFGVPELLSRFYTPEGEVSDIALNRGASTLGNSFALGDVMVFSMSIAVAWLFMDGRRRNLLAVLAALFAFGAIASGQFSSVIGLAVGTVAVGWVLGRLQRIFLAAIPVSLLAGAALQPVITRRLQGFDSPQGLPKSWIGRLENLRRFFWPELFSDYNYVLGVRPSARVPAPDSWREWVWIESGHTWLLWNGGIPLLAAFIGFLWVASVTTFQAARRSTGAVAVAGAAAFAAVVVQAVLMTLDPHIILRGAADFTFVLLALSIVRVGSPASPETGQDAPSVLTGVPGGGASGVRALAAP